MKESDWARIGMALTLAVTAACSEVSAKPIDGPTAETPRASTPIPPTETAKATETATPTEAPDLLKDVVLPEGTGTLRKEGDQWLFSSPLVEANLGQNVPVVITEQKNVDGETQTWLGLKAHPDWPLFIQNADGSWRQAMRYVQVTERFNSSDYNQETFFIRPATNNFNIGGVVLSDWDYGPEISEHIYEFSPVIAKEPYQDDEGNWVGVFGFPFDNKSESPMLLFDVVLRPRIADAFKYLLDLQYPNSNRRPVGVDRGKETDLEKLLAQNVGQQIRINGLGEFPGTKPSTSNLEKDPYYLGRIRAQVVIENYGDTNKILYSLEDKNYIEAHHTGLYIWGLNTVWMDVNF